MYVCIFIHSEDRILLAITGNKIDCIKLKQSLDWESFQQVFSFLLSNFCQVGSLKSLTGHLSKRISTTLPFLL